MTSPPPLALAYHGIGDVRLRQDRHGLLVRPRDFRRHVECLRRWRYRIVPFGEWADLVARGDGRGHCTLTFDDGFADNLHALVPLLRELETTATVFVVSGWLGRAHPDAPWARVLTEDELRELARSGVEIGAHTATHPHLPTLPRERQLAEMRDSKVELERVVGAPVELFAYPYGEADDETVDACREAGFRAACLTAGAGAWDDPLRLPRQAMANDSTLVGLRLKRDDRYERLMTRFPPRALRKAKRLVQRAVR